MNEPTVPFGEPELWRVSAFRRAMDGGPSENSRFNALSPSLMADLQRFEQPGAAGAEVLEALAACLRHAHDMALHLDRDGHVLPITVFPRERLFHSPMALSALYETRFDTVQLLQVERAALRAPGAASEQAAPASQCHPLGPLLWHMALHGPRRDLLPELAGAAVYRVAPDLDVPSELTGALAASVGRLRSEKVSLRTLGHWPGMSRERASRLLNGLYLQAGLIVSRAHPAASRDSWFAGLGRR